MKKKILSIALVIALLAIMVGGSLAYFTAQDKVTNTFTIGSVKIEIYENGEATDEPETKFDKPLVPVVKTDDLANDPSYMKKEVEVYNTGLNSAYVRTHIAIPSDLVGFLYLDLDEKGWTRQIPDSTAVVGEVEYTVFTYDYDTALESGAHTGKLLKGVYLGSKVDLQEDEKGDLYFILRNEDGTVTKSDFMAHKKTGEAYATQTVSVLVASQAIQSQGFDNGQPGDNTKALTTGFPANPWAAAN